MPADQQASTNGHAPFPEQRGQPRSELDALRATCHRQAHVIDTLKAALVDLTIRLSQSGSAAPGARTAAPADRAER